ncbi:metalloregulator ArsR/SmtB family transcription factor [Roseivirga sp. BDSF3-8]|uniref:metalloregulator ArsR/SmtB family transcription factor n=1 Tax=Roseivirga sp. BDSF3-8 TaxID=3241598 RepID=UPI00353183B6
MRLKHFNLPFSVQLFKALSDEARVRILVLLQEKGNLCISDLELILDFTQTKTSRHITYLRNAGILASRKADQYVFYYIKEEVENFVRQMLKYVQSDGRLKKDLEIHDILESNRELAKNKVDPDNRRLP